MALTEAAQDNKKAYYDSISIVELFKGAGFETVWLTNQNLMGAWDNLISVIAHQADTLVGINKSIGETTKTQRFDGDLVSHFKKSLNKKTKKNRVIFVHLMGSHGDYCLRYPDQYKKFTSKVDMGSFGKAISDDTDLTSILNCYDNSVLYNDFVVNELIQSLKDSSGVRSLVYISDHADDVIKKIGHNSAVFSFDMVQIPMLIWMSEEFKSTYKAKHDLLNLRGKMLFPNDRLYDTLIGLAGIETSHYRSEFDLTSNYYDIDEMKAAVVHGMGLYSDARNNFYWQQRNIDILNNKNIADKFLPYRVNTTGKLKDIWSSGFRSFETDAFFDYKKDGLFYSGYDQESIGFDFETFLESINTNKISKVMFSIKNITIDNSEQALIELNKLDEKYSLKKRMVLVANWDGIESQAFQTAGWTVSYAFPEEEMLIALEASNDSDLKILAKKFSEKVKLKNVKYISYDKKNYTFVKDFLEPLIPAQIFYHVSHGLSLASDKFFDDVEKDRIYSDQRIVTFSSSFQSSY